MRKRVTTSRTGEATSTSVSAAPRSASCATKQRAGHGLRWRNTLEPKRYVAATRAIRDDKLGEGDGVSMFSEELDAIALLRERIMLGLRLAHGVDLARASADLGIDPWTPERLRAIDRLVERGRLTREGDVLRIPRAAWLFTDDIAARLF